MSNQRILVADSSLTIQKVIKLALSNEGYEIQSVSDGKDALEQIALFRPDIVLVDASLPKVSAFDLRASAGKPNVRYVLMASAFDTVDEDKVKRSGFDGRLVKPFDPAHLRQVLGDVLKLGKKSEFTVSNELKNNDMNFENAGTDSLWESNTSPESEWSVEERHSTPMAGPSTVGDRTLTNLWKSEHVIEPPARATEPPDTSFSFETNETPTNPNLVNIYNNAPDAAVFTDPDHRYTGTPPAVSEKKMEEIMARQFAQTLEKMARERLPEIAERIIRQEIGKLLANPP